MNNKTNKRPAVSIILTVYNRAGYLSRCIESVLKQSFKDWELIAIDDGSKDNTLEILEAYGRRHDNIKVFTQQNMKLPLSRNRGIKLSSGKFITFIDSDDEYKGNHLLERVNYLSEHKDIDMLHGGFEIIGDEYVPDKNDTSKLIHLSECTVGATFFGKREVFEELNGFKNIPYSEDSEFFERAGKIFTIRKVNFKTYIYHRDAPDSITNSYARE